MNVNTETSLCMMCGLPKFDGPDSGYVDEYGDMWTYCEDCDEWTSHPFEQASKNRNL